MADIASKETVVMESYEAETERQSGGAEASNISKSTTSSSVMEELNKDNVAGKSIHWKLDMENYHKQNQQWPTSGRHILAHFDDKSVVVYQAFKPSIADYAVKNQCFGGPDYSFERMSWVKTNFMWMMYRCGWAQKVNQERVLAVRITREGFELILSQALTAERQKAKKLDTKNIEVRLQWDPDHSPKGGNLTRRAIQLGMKGKTLQDYASKFIMNIKDITDFVHEQYRVLQTEGEQAIVSPKERIYTPSSSRVCSQIDLDFYAEQTVVSFG